MHVVVYIALSLDGRIAGPGDDVAWLDPYTDTHAAYETFRASIGHAVMGRKTYDFARSFEPWVYPGLPVTVLTSSELTDAAPDVRAHPGPPSALLRAIPGADDARVWLAGGGETIAAFLAEDLVDELQLFVMPVVLGAGPSLVPEMAPIQTRFELVDTDRYPSGVMELRYRRKR